MFPFIRAATTTTNNHNHNDTAKMTSPKTLDFPLPPRRPSVTSDLRSPPLAPFTNFATVAPAQQQLSRILELTNRYRTQTVTLLARQEALAAEQKTIFDLERQLWITEREIWAEERRLLTGGALPPPPTAGNSAAANIDSNLSTSPPPVDHATRFLSISSMAESTGTAAEQNLMPSSLSHPPLPEPIGTSAPRKQNSNNTAGVRLNWHMKQGMNSDRIPGIPNESVSPKGTRNGSLDHRNGSLKMDSPRYPPPGVLGLPGQTISEDLNEDREPGSNGGDEDYQISPALLAEATKLVYGEKAMSKRNSFSSNSTKRPIPALFKTLTDNNETKSIRRASSSIYPSSMRNARYTNSYSDSEEDDVFEVSSQARKLGQKNRKRSASQTDKPNDIPLRLRPSSNFGAAFGAINTNNQQNLAPPLPTARQGSLSSTTFYHPETPVDSFNSQHSFREAGWNAPGIATTSSIPKVTENNIVGDHGQPARLVKPTVEPINVKSAPWGITSTNLTSSPTFGTSEINLQQPQQGGLKPSPSGLTSSLSIGGSSQNSPISKGPTAAASTNSDKFSLSSSRYSEDSIVMDAPHPHHIHNNGNTNGTYTDVNHKYTAHTSSSTPSAVTTNRHSEQGGKKTSPPPMYTWTPPPPLPTSPRSTTSSGKSGMYANAILLSPSTLAPSTKTTNPRLSAVGCMLPIGISLGSPPLERMGTSSMLLSVSSRSEGGDDLDDDVDELEGHEVEITTDDEDNDEEDDDVVEIAAGNTARGVVGGAAGIKMIAGSGGGGYHDAPVEIVRDNGRWGNVLPGGMI
ncbi:hypothetical protein AA313_de0202653 [Arthrobotrys entomopaga]|nr:hypothetical protein AA313_de0202653 [Arthrobotrys entomopaga]